MKRYVLGTAAVLLSLALAGQSAGASADDVAPTDPAATTPAAQITADELTDDPSPSADPTSDPNATPNQAPVTADDTATVTAGQSVTVAVLANDTDDGLGRPEGTPPALEVVGVTGAGTDGVATFTSDTVTFRAATTTTGPVGLEYQVSDGELASTGALTVQVSAPPAARSVSIGVASTVVALRRYSVHGTIRPVRPGPVYVRVQRRAADGHWAGFAKDRTDRYGRYSVRFTPTRIRTETFRAVADWPNGRHATSGSLSRRVVALPDVAVSGPLTRGQVPYSWRSGCPVPPRSLRKISINSYDYAHTIRRGSLVVRSSEVSDVVAVFRTAFAQQFPIRSMRPSDYFYKGGSRTPTQSDVAAMNADNTSAFNCRPVTGNPYRVSQHSYGNAIDINTVRNPYVTGSRVYPSWAGTYLNRSVYRTGMILSSGAIATEMRQQGWLWGARWAHPDYQHFSSNGG